MHTRADEDEEEQARDGWETISMDGHLVGIRTSTIDDKCQAFDTLVVYASLLGARFAPYLAQALDLTLPALQFYFHEGVREAACRLVPLLAACGKAAGTLTPEVVHASLAKVVYCIRMERDPTFVASLYKAIGDTLRVVGVGALTPELTNGLMDGTRVQLQHMAERRRSRGSGLGASGPGPGAGGQGQAQGQDEEEQEELALVEEMEAFALEDMEKTLRILDAHHPLLIAIASVRQLGSGRTWDESGEETLGHGDVEG